VKEILELVYALRLQPWRREEKCENLLYLNDEQNNDSRIRVVDYCIAMVDGMHWSGDGMCAMPVLPDMISADIVFFLSLNGNQD